MIPPAPPRRGACRLSAVRCGTRRLFLRHYVPGPFEDLRQHMPMHLFWLFNPIQGEDGGRYVVNACFKPHQSQIVLDVWPHGEERSWNFISIRKIMLGDH